MHCICVPLENGTVGDHVDSAAMDCIVGFATGIVHPGMDFEPDDLSEIKDPVQKRTCWVAVDEKGDSVIENLK